MNLKQIIFYNKLKKGNKINCDFRFKGGVVYSTLNEDQLNLPENYQIIDGKVYYKDKPICEFKQSDDISMDTFEISDSFIEEATKDKEEKKEEAKSESKEEKKEETKSESESKEENETEEDEDEDEYEAEIDFTKVKRLFFPVRRLFGKIKNIFTKKESNIEIPEEVKKEETKDDKDKKDSKKEEINNKEKTSEKKETKETEEFNKNKEKALKLIDKIEKELNKIHKLVNSRKDLDFSYEDDQVKNTKSEKDKAFKDLADYKKVDLHKLNEVYLNINSVRKRLEKGIKITPKLEPIVKPIDFSKEEAKKVSKEEAKKEEVKVPKEEPKKDESKAIKKETKKAPLSLDERLKEKFSIKENDFVFNSVDNIKNTIKSDDKKRYILDTYKIALEEEKVSIIERIKNIEEFIKTHNFYLKEDLEMIDRMKNNIKVLNDKYKELDNKSITLEEHIKKVFDGNDAKSKRMSFYTQSAMGIDKAVDKLEKERQERINKFLEDKNATSLNNEETDRIYAKKAELLRLKAECLRRKAEENKYYEEMAARMTSALKR